MRGAQPGVMVPLTYDWWGEGAPPWVGHYLVSTGGSGYLIAKARSTSRPLRYRYLCEKVAPAEIPDGARVYMLEWNGREWGSRKRDQLDIVALLQELGTVEEVEEATWAEPPPVLEVKKGRSVGPTWICLLCLEAGGGHTDWCVSHPDWAARRLRLAS